MKNAAKIVSRVTRIVSYDFTENETLVVLHLLLTPRKPYAYLRS